MKRSHIPGSAHTGSNSPDYFTVRLVLSKSIPHSNPCLPQCLQPGRLVQQRQEAAGTEVPLPVTGPDKGSTVEIP